MKIKAVIRKIKRAGFKSVAENGEGFGDEVRRSEKSSALFRSFRSAQQHARHDGNRSEHRSYLETIAGMIEKTKNPRFVWDSYRRLIQMYSDVVMEKAEGIDRKKVWACASNWSVSWRQ